MNGIRGNCLLMAGVALLCGFSAGTSQLAWAKGKPAKKAAAATKPPNAVAAEIAEIRQAVGLSLWSEPALEAPPAGSSQSAANESFQATLRKLLDQDFPPLAEVGANQTLPCVYPALGEPSVQRGFYQSDPPARLATPSRSAERQELEISLRALARQLDGHAANLEDTREFRQADHFRRLAETLRSEARELAE